MKNKNTNTLEKKLKPNVDSENIDVKNEAGHMTIFPSYINHYTTPHSSFRPRITIAFDISPFKLTDHSIRL